MTTDHHPEIEFSISLPEPFRKLKVCYRRGKITCVRLFHGASAAPRRTRPQLPRQSRDIRLEKRLRADFAAYFSGRKVAFDYPLDLERFTLFQKAVWAAMRQIPYGQTRSYRWIAQKIGKPRAFRAVGNACGKNPFLIIQPCHRVVGSRGRLGGFSAGLDLKKALLNLEGVAL